MDAHAEVRALLAEMTAKIANIPLRPAMHRELQDLSDQIETLTKAYMEPTPTACPWKQLGFSHQESRIMALLHKRKGQIVVYDSLLNMLYPNGWVPADAINTLKVFMVKIRSKLKGVPLPYRVETIWATGFRLTEIA